MKSDPDTCLRCGEIVDEASCVHIIRMVGGEELEDGWGAKFCSDVHAAEWVENPTQPPDTATDLTWHDRLGITGCLLALLAFIVCGIGGLIAIAGWIVDQL